MNSYIFSQMIFDDSIKTIQWGEDSLLNKWCWENWKSTHQRMKLDLGLPWWSSGKESAFQCRGRGFNPCGELRSHVSGQLSPCTTLLSLHASMREPACCNYRAHAPWSLHATAREKPALHNKEPARCNKRSHMPKWRSHMPQLRPNAAKKRKKK